MQTAQDWTKSYIQLIVSYVHPKNSNHLRSHLRAIMALDHRRLIRPGERPSFLRSTNLLYKILPTILVRVNQPFIPFIHHICGQTVLWGIVFTIQTSYRMQFFTILEYKLHSFNIQDDRSTRGLLAKKVQKLTYTASRFSLLKCELW